MQNYCKTIGALAAASALVAGNASAEVEYTLGTGYTSEYLWRGFNLGEDLVEASVSATTEWNGLNWSAGAWYGSYDQAIGADIFDDGGELIGRYDESDIDELDLFAEVSKDLGFVTAGLGYIYYMNEDALDRIDDSQEVYVKLSRDLGFANAYAAYYWDVEGDNDGYSEIGLSRGFELNQCLTLNLGTNLGFFFESDDVGSWTTKASLDWGFAESAKLSPFMAIAVDLAEKQGLNDEIVGGCMLSTSF
jgi:RimJ/RimL family protein N-acetyltransferase